MAIWLEQSRLARSCDLIHRQDRRAGAGAGERLKKLKLPNDEKLSRGLKQLSAFHASFLAWSIDEEDPELEPMALDELVARGDLEEGAARIGNMLATASAGLPTDPTTSAA